VFISAKVKGLGVGVGVGVGTGVGLYNNFANLSGNESFVEDRKTDRFKKNTDAIRITTKPNKIIVRLALEDSPLK
jgi:hypothetical protein